MRHSVKLARFFRFYLLHEYSFDPNSPFLTIPLNKYLNKKKRMKRVTKKISESSLHYRWEGSREGEGGSVDVPVALA